jgi:hypothetical protein
MTLHQLTTLADQHRAAHQSGGQPLEAQSGPSLMSLAAMQ